MPVTFSAERAYNRIAARVGPALNAVALEIADNARERAPVRKVFKGSVGRAGTQSAVEVKAEAHLRRQLQLAPGPVRTQRTPASRIHSLMALRQLARPGVLRARTPLTSRGRYELRSGRANFSGSGGSTLGGRLRGEIHVAPAEGLGPVWVARVVSPTPYAKYVEFGTRHNRAQPYLRPALSQVRESFRTQMAAAVRAGR